MARTVPSTSFDGIESILEPATGMLPTEAIQRDSANCEAASSKHILPLQATALTKISLRVRIDHDLVRRLDPSLWAKGPIDFDPAGG